MSCLDEVPPAREPYCWVTLSALRRIRCGVEPSDRKAARLLLSALIEMAADAFDGRHDGFTATLRDVMGWAELSENTVLKARSALISAGCLRIENPTRRSTRWVLLSPDPTSQPSTVEGIEPSTVEAPRPRQEVGKKEERSMADAMERSRRPRTTYRGKTVPAATVDSATRLLSVFEECTGRRFRSATTDGRASPDLRQVIGAMLNRPHVEHGEWVAAIRNTIANPPDWVDGKLRIGHVFGERAADWALSNDGQPPAVGSAGRRETAAERIDALVMSLGGSDSAYV